MEYIYNIMTTISFLIFKHCNNKNKIFNFLKKTIIYTEDIKYIYKIMNKSTLCDDNYTIIIYDSKFINILSQAYNRFNQYDILHHNNLSINDFSKRILLCINNDIEYVLVDEHENSVLIRLDYKKSIDFI